MAKNRVEKVVVSLKRHTVGYIINGSFVTRHKAALMAQDGELEGVCAGTSNNRKFIKSLPDSKRLMDLPQIVHTASDIRPWRHAKVLETQA